MAYAQPGSASEPVFARLHRNLGNLCNEQEGNGEAGQGLSRVGGLLKACKRAKTTAQLHAAPAQCCRCYCCCPLHATRYGAKHWVYIAPVADTCCASLKKLSVLPAACTLLSVDHWPVKPRPPQHTGEGFHQLIFHFVAAPRSFVLCQDPRWVCMKLRHQTNCRPLVAQGPRRCIQRAVLCPFVTTEAASVLKYSHSRTRSFHCPCTFS